MVLWREEPGRYSEEKLRIIEIGKKHWHTADTFFDVRPERSQHGLNLHSQQHWSPYTYRFSNVTVVRRPCIYINAFQHMLCPVFKRVISIQFTNFGAMC